MSIDGSAEAFERNFTEMPWLAVPYSDEPRIASLKQKFGINGIPTLIIVDTAGNLVRAEGREEITKDPAAALEAWNNAKAAQTNAAHWDVYVDASKSSYFMIYVWSSIML